jgi:poly(3-hydroxyalkanoate) synthetase
MLIETRGRSLIDGMENLLGDLRKGQMSITDEDGSRLATTSHRNTSFTSNRFSTSTDAFDACSGDSKRDGG